MATKADDGPELDGAAAAPREIFQQNKNDFKSAWSAWVGAGGKSNSNRSL